MEEEKKVLGGESVEYSKSEDSNQNPEEQNNENQVQENQINAVQTNENQINEEQINQEINNTELKKEVPDEIQSNQYSEQTELKYEEVQPQYVEVEIKQKKNANDSYFDGKLFELIGYRILHFIISVFSLGIASPWSRCMLLSYRINHTVYNGKRLKFEGTGGSLFGLRLKWFFLTLITFGIYLFFKPVSKLKWIMSNIHFEDETFIKGESYFSGNTFGLILVNIVCKILNILTLGLLSPFTYCYKHKWIVKHTIINRKKIIFNGKALDLFLHKLLWNFLTIITIGIFSFWYYIAESKWLTKKTHIKVQGEEEEKDKSLFIGIVIGIVSLAILAVIIPAIIMTKNTEPNYDYVTELQNILQNETKQELIEIYNNVEYKKGKKYKINDLESLSKYDDIKGYYIMGGDCTFVNSGWPMIGDYYEESYARPVYTYCAVDDTRSTFVTAVLKDNDYRIILVFNVNYDYVETDWIYINDKFIKNVITCIKSMFIAFFEDLEGGLTNF